MYHTAGRVRDFVAMCLSDPTYKNLKIEELLEKVAVNCALDKTTEAARSEFHNATWDPRKESFRQFTASLAATYLMAYLTTVLQGGIER